MPSLTEKLALFDDTLPLARARTIPSLWYFDSEIYQAELDKVFAGSWQMVGRLDQVAGPGTFFTADIAGEPIIVLRDEQGVLRAFHNVCRHKAAQVINEPEGRVTKLRCRYHGWTYDLCGRLRGTPEFGGVEDFAMEQHGLPSLAVATWGPLVFVHQGQPRQALDEFLAPLPERSAHLGLDKLKFVRRREYVLQCNWKVFVDNYQDGGYHVNTVHPGLAGALDYSQYQTENFAHCGLQSSPIKPSSDPTINKVRTGDFAYYWWIFPNLMINMYQGVMDTNLVVPFGGPDACKVYFDFYFTDNDTPEQRKFNEDSIEVAHQVQIEDWTVCEEVQRGLKSHTYATGRFSVKRESGCYHFHQLLARRLAPDRRRWASAASPAGFPLPPGELPG